MEYFIMVRSLWLFRQDRIFFLVDVLKSCTEIYYFNLNRYPSDVGLFRAELKYTKNLHFRLRPVTDYDVWVFVIGSL